jgi:choline-glycine betaine transporter
MAVGSGILVGGVLAVLLTHFALSRADGRGVAVLQIACASSACAAGVLLIWFVRGNDSWSNSLGAAWWAVLAAAVVLSMVAIGLQRRCSAALRTAVIALSLPALVVLPIIVVALFQALGAAAD